MVDKIRVLTAHLHVCDREDIVPFSLAHAVCSHEFTNRCAHAHTHIHTHHLSPHFFPLVSHYSKLRSETIVEASHYNLMLCVACMLLLPNINC